MIRGFFSGAFWGLLVGGVTLVAAALLIEARRSGPPEPEVSPEVATRPAAEPLPVLPDVAGEGLGQWPDTQIAEAETSPDRRTLVPRPVKPVLPAQPAIRSVHPVVDSERPPLPAPPLPGGPDAVAPTLAQSGVRPAPAEDLPHPLTPEPTSLAAGPTEMAAIALPAPPTPPEAPNKGPVGGQKPNLGAGLHPPADVSGDGIPAGVAAASETVAALSDPAAIPKTQVSELAVDVAAAPLPVALAGRDGGFIAIVATTLPQPAPDWLLTVLAREDLKTDLEITQAAGLDGVSMSEAAVTLTSPALAATMPEAAVLYRHLQQAEDATPEALAAIAERIRRDGQAVVLLDPRRADVLAQVDKWLTEGEGANLTPVPLSFLIR